MPGRVLLSAFGDEAASELGEQMDVLESCGIRHIELRGVWGKNVLKLTGPEVGRVRSEMADRGFAVSAIGSPIGKVDVGNDWAAHRDSYLRAVDIASQLGTRYIRLFSFYIPEGRRAEEFRTPVMERMGEMAAIAARAGLVAVHENESGIYGDNAERCLDILKTVNSPSLRAVFDPANFLQCGVRPYEEALPALESYVEYMHIKDAIKGSGKVVPAGDGDGRIRDVVARLLDGGFCSFLTLEPHLAVAGRFSGFSGPDLFREAARALTGMLDELGVDYS